MGINRDDEAVLGHLPLVRAIAQAVHSKLPHHIELDDLINAGTIGLLDAVAKFDTSKRTGFGTYARFRIRGSILDSIRSQDAGSRHLRQRSKDVATASRKLLIELGRVPTRTEVAASANLSERELAGFLVDARNAAAISGAQSPAAANEAAVPVATRAESDPFHSCAMEEVQMLLRKSIASLDQRHQAVIVQSFYQDRSSAEIAGHLGVHQSRVSQMRQEALSTLSNRLQRAGIRSSLEMLPTSGAMA